MKWFKKQNSAKLASRNNATPFPKILFVSDYLSERSICFFPPGSAKENILYTLVGSLSLQDPAPALNAVLEREKMGGTVMDSTIAIPHARLKGLKKIEMAVGICHESALSKDRPNLYFLFLSPQEDTKIHLLFLSSLSSLFQIEGFTDELLRSKAPHEVIQKIRQIEKGI